MEGICLQFYLSEFVKHPDGKLMYEWLLELAKKTGIKGGSVFKSIAGFGQHGHLHEEHFYELASEVPVKVEFFLLKSKADEFIELLKKENHDLFYSILPAEFGRVKETSK